MIKKHFIPAGCILLVSLLIHACGTGNISREFTKVESVRLLTSDSSKQWIRISRTENGSSVELTECQEDYSLHLVVTASDSILYRIDNLPTCNSSNTEADTVLAAKWSLTQNINLISTDTLNLKDLDDTDLSPIGISILTPRKLNIQYLDENSNLVSEEYIF